MSIITKNAVKAIAQKFKLRGDPSDQMFFDVLWELYQIGNKYKRTNKKKIEDDLSFNYKALAGAILNTNVIHNRVGSLNNIPMSLTNSPIKRIKEIDTYTKDNPNSVTRGNENKINKLVIFSDHHITPKNHRHNYFGEHNKGLYMEILKWYSDNDFGLIENGDVEEYTLFEPNNTIINNINSLIDKGKGPVKKDIGSIKIQELKAERLRFRLNIVENIWNDHQDLQDLIIEKFVNKGRNYYTKITGNHDPFIENALINKLPRAIRNNLCDGLRIFQGDRSLPQNKIPKYFVTHGHQFDESTLPQHADMIGEIFSETLGWTIEGADRYWKNKDTEIWRNNDVISNFRNILATAEVETNFRVFEPIYEALMKNHEIAWEYFESKNRNTAVFNEVFEGKRYFKVRHLSELRLINELDKLYSEVNELRGFRNRTKIIIGHTHEARIQPKKSTRSKQLIDFYLNTGSAGRFQNLIWGLEIDNGREIIVSWTKSGRKLIRNEWHPNSDGELVKQLSR